MTHFNHEWDTTKTPAVPVSVGDRFYAQDLNDDFNYLKHLPYEAILQGRTKGIMIPPTDTWNASSHSLALSGGFGVVALNIPVLDTNKDFTIPPKTTSVSRYERVAFPNATLVLPNDGNAHYIVATPTKRSLLQRGKALFSENYACRVKYDGIITIQDTAPSTNQILIGLCHNNEYLLCKDFVFNQGIDTIKLHKWYGENKITDSLVPLLKSYYNTGIYNIETHISINIVSDRGIAGGTFSNCTISIGTVNGGGVGIYGGTFSNCTININTVGNDGDGIYSSTFNNCIININTVSSSGDGIYSGTFSNCTINISTVNGGDGGITGGTFNNCTINIDAVGDNINGIYGSTFNNCIINIGTIGVNGYGVSNGTFNNCTITINTVGDDSTGIVYSTFNDCAISINTVNGGGVGIYVGTFSNCTINIGTVGNRGRGVSNGTFNNCNINIGTVSINGYGVFNGTFSNCTINISTVNGGGVGIANTENNKMYFVHATLRAVPILSSVLGKGFVVNDTTIIGFN